MSVDFSGTWKANLPRSRFLGPPPKAVIVEIEHSDPELKEEVLLTRIDGTEDRVVFKCWTAGERNEHLLNDNTVRGSAMWEGEELVIESWVQFGTREMHICDCWSLSSDGQTLYMEHRKGDLAGQLTVFERLG